LGVIDAQKYTPSLPRKPVASRVIENGSFYWHPVNPKHASNLLLIETKINCSHLANKLVCETQRNLNLKNWFWLSSKWHSMVHLAAISCVRANDSQKMLEKRRADHQMHLRLTTP